MTLQATLYLLTAVLALGTIYAWYQFALVLAKKCDTCSVSLKSTPFKSKCFVGAIFFTVALILSVIALTLV